MYNGPIKNNKLIQEAFERGYNDALNEDISPPWAQGKFNRSIQNGQPAKQPRQRLQPNAPETAGAERGGGHCPPAFPGCGPDGHDGGEWCRANGCDGEWRWWGDSRVRWNADCDGGLGCYEFRSRVYPKPPIGPCPDGGWGCLDV